MPRELLNLAEHAGSKSGVNQREAGRGEEDDVIFNRWCSIEL
jgi:hypothetical protein